MNLKHCTIISLLCIALTSLVLSGCGSSSTPAATTSSAATSSTGTGNVDYATARIAEISSLPKFVVPGPAFDAMKAMAGKSIMSIPTSSANPFTQNIEIAMQGVAKRVGFKFLSYANQGQPSQWVQGMNFGINQKYNLIDLLAGTNPEVLHPQIAAAKAAGIAVVSSHVTGTGPNETPAGVTANLPIDYKNVGRYLADWVIMKTQGKGAHVLVITSNELLSTPAEVAGIKEEFATRGGSTYVITTQNSPIPDWSTKIQPIVQSAVLADPNLSYIIPIYDSMSQFVVAGLQASGKVGKIKIATFNGTPFVLGLVAQGQVEMDIGENLDWIGSAILDDEMRLLAGLQFVQDEHIPLYIFDKNNVASAGNPPQLSTGYGNAYVAGYNKLWGLTK